MPYASLVLGHSESSATSSEDRECNTQRALAEARDLDDIENLRQQNSDTSSGNPDDYNEDDDEPGNDDDALGAGLALLGEMTGEELQDAGEDDVDLAMLHASGVGEGG